ncbi:hypothetical protein AVEN_209301-1 [Araneus ventricosus]|uniref:Uncharacterized protein n=1 Tax=Araneus ventricosus TaxID=182803 RepID=A0A4Y2CB52_ARAVE|nr:hypothetical protein AVEN_209301-1 [Araneus ventricosus]
MKSVGISILLRLLTSVGFGRQPFGVQVLTYKEFTTYLFQVEANKRLNKRLNSSTLVSASSDPDNLSVITPADYLIGSTLDAILESNVTDFKIP